MTDDAHMRWFRSIAPFFQEAAEQLARETANITVDADLTRRLYKKSEVGWVKHDGQIVNMDDADLADEEIQELLDWINYRATRLARRAGK